jgi:hypothetical protein
MARILGIETEELLRLVAAGVIPTNQSAHPKRARSVTFDPLLVKKSLQSISLHKRYSNGSST